MGGMDLMQMWTTMGWVAKVIAIILVIMSMISFGVAIERIYTFAQARKQSKLYAPQVAKHLKDGRLKDAIAISSSKNYRYSHLAKVVLAGMQEYQFQQEAGGNLSREDLVDTVRRAIQRASALTANDLKKGVSALATIGATAPFVVDQHLAFAAGNKVALFGDPTAYNNGIGQAGAGLDEHDDLLGPLDFALPPVMRDHSRQDIDAGREPPLDDGAPRPLRLDNRGPSRIDEHRAFHRRVSA